MSVAYVPGRGVAVVGTDVLVLLPADVEPRLVRRVYEALRPGAGVADVLQVLTGEFASSLTRIPPFALAVVHEGGVHAVARGGFEVRVGGPGGESVSGEGVATWSERRVTRADDVALLAPGAEPGGESWPLDGGIVFADVLVLAGPPTSEAASVAAPESAAAPESVVDPASVAYPEPVAAPEPVVAPVPVSVPEPTAVPEETVVPVPVPVSVPAPVPAAAPEETVVPVETMLPEAEPDSFDHLWGDTVLVPVERAAVRADGSDVDDAEPLPHPAGHDAAEPAPPAAESAPPAAGAVLSGASAVPSAASAVPSAAHAVPSTASGEPPTASAEGAASTPAWTPPFTLDVPSPSLSPSTTAGGTPETSPGARENVAGAATEHLGEHDGLTVVGGSFALEAPGAAEPAPGPVGGVGAGGPVGRVRLSTGPELDLDRPMVVGRKPRVSRVGGTAVPRLVTVPSPEQDISRSHLEIRLEGVSVLVVDLGSTNGTTLLRTGQLPVRLHPHEAQLVVDGDVVDLGEDVTLTFEGLA